MKRFYITVLHFETITTIMLLLILLNVSCIKDNKQSPTRFDNLQIRSEHPRIWIDAQKTAWLKEKCKGKSIKEIQELAGPSITGLALTYHITGEEKWGRIAISQALGKLIDPGSPYFDLNTPDGIGKRNSIQSSLVDQAICYDWCYPLLSPEEKTEFRNLMVPQMRKNIDFKRAWRSFHNGMYAAAWPVTAAIFALDGDEPFTKDAWTFLKPELEDVLKTFDILFPDGEWPEGNDYNRHSTYPAIRIFLAIKSATGADFLSSSAHIKNTGKYIIYGAKANGLSLPCDDNDWPYVGPWEHWALLMLNEEFKDGFNQTFINHCPAERFKLEPQDQYANLLWYDSTIKEKPLSDLPLSRIFIGKGLVMTRSNWEMDTQEKRANSTWLSFHCGDYYGDHVHYDINSFTISHNGELAIDAGRYDCDWGVEDWTVSKDSSKIGKSQFFNYYRRTIAHNTILVKDPNEKMPLNLLNDGGQIDQLRVKGARNVPEDYDQGNFPSEEGIGKCDWVTNPDRWETGNITSYKATNDFMYVCGDGSKSYSSTKLKSFVRQLLFLQPNIIVVMDRVESTNADYKKTWLLHSVNEPKIDSKGNSFELTADEGRLVCLPVLPHKLIISKIGGPGKEFLVDTVQFKCGLESCIDPQELHYAEISGAWRIEESPSVSATKDYFLNVIMVTNKDSKEVPSVTVLSETTTEITIRVSLKNGQEAILSFAKGEKPSAHLKLKNGEKVFIDEEMPETVELEKGRDN